MIRNRSSVRSRASRLVDLLAGAVLGALATAAMVGVTARPVDRAPAVLDAPVGGAMEARALSVIDGDTIEARVSTFPGQEIVARIRLAGVDAPERASRCAAETAAAKAATEALARMVEGRRLTLTGVHGDKYFGRVVARVATREAGDLARALVAEGHGRAYSGGKRGGWC